VQDARRDQVQDGLLAIDDQRVAGVVPALEAHHGIRPLGEQVDDLALALVTPLGADHDYASAHPILRFSAGRPQVNSAPDRSVRGPGPS
jgi:hypothetical protein